MKAHDLAQYLLKCENLEVTASIDISTNEKIIHSLNFKLEKNEKKVFLYVNLNDLNNNFKKNHKYRFFAIPKSQKDIFIESKKLLIWK